MVESEDDKVIPEPEENNEDGPKKKELDIDDSMYCLSFITMIKKVKKKFNYTDADLEDNFFKCSFLFFI